MTEPKTRRGAPTSYRFPPELRAEISDAAWRARVSGAEYIRQAIREKLERDTEPDEKLAAAIHAQLIRDGAEERGLR